MKTDNNFEWMKFEKRLIEIESRISGPKRTEGGAASSNTGAADIRLNKKSAITGQESLDVAPLMPTASFRQLTEEIKFLKAEIEQLKNAREESVQLKRDIENISMQKDSEITRLFATNRQLEEENRHLKFKVTKNNYDMADSHHERRHRSSNKQGLLEWLAKPLIIIEPE